jgi:hypothetical protein
MKKAVELAGEFAAHAIWCVSEGGPLTPILALETPGGGKKMLRFAAENLEDGAEYGRAELESNREGAVHAVLLVDGYLTLDGPKTDAILIDIKVYREPAVSLSMAVPYRHPESPDGFAVYRPKFLSELRAGDHEALGEAFFRGVDSHEEGARVWNEHIDKSR